jgi:ADP-ribose pyrophosphatase YjhB (NUDIX family)
MIKIARADLYGAVMLHASQSVLLCRLADEFGGEVWTFPKAQPKPDESPAETAVRAALEDTGYPAEILEVVPGAFPDTTSLSAFYVVGRAPGERKRAGSAASSQWVDFRTAQDLIAQTQGEAERERDLAILRAAQDVCVRLKWSQRPAVWEDDWRGKKMPRQRREIALDLRFDEFAMARIRKGLLPRAMEEKWFAWFEKSCLHLHRSWTGYCIYEVNFVREGDHWRAISATVNSHPKQRIPNDHDEDRRWIAGIIAGQLLYE